MEYHKLYYASKSLSPRSFKSVDWGGGVIFLNLEKGYYPIHISSSNWLGCLIRRVDLVEVLDVLFSDLNFSGPLHPLIIPKKFFWLIFLIF